MRFCFPISQMYGMSICKDVMLNNVQRFEKKKSNTYWNCIGLVAESAVFLHFQSLLSLCYLQSYLLVEY